MEPTHSPSCCALCRRTGTPLTRHHLVPQSRSRIRKKRKQMEGDLHGKTIDLCHPCHSMIHAVLTEKQLESHYHSAEQLLQHPEIAKFVQWVRKQDPTRRIAVRWSQDRR